MLTRRCRGAQQLLSFDAALAARPLALPRLVVVLAAGGSLVLYFAKLAFGVILNGRV